MANIEKTSPPGELFLKAILPSILTISALTALCVPGSKEPSHGSIEPPPEPLPSRDKEADLEEAEFPKRITLDVPFATLKEDKTNKAHSKPPQDITTEELASDLPIFRDPTKEEELENRVLAKIVGEISVLYREIDKQVTANNLEVLARDIYIGDKFGEHPGTFSVIDIAQGPDGEDHVVYCRGKGEFASLYILPENDPTAVRLIQLLIERELVSGVPLREIPSMFIEYAYPK
ncbi:MAG: hypothetical protein D6808_01805 [Candidatus Dadabacteria bacterium]|nr:MAG: hypothetical protein D6808_01805 [Candidatus Dadabacteria bacterium]